MSKLTADTITDEQIEALRLELIAESGIQTSDGSEPTRCCDRALYGVVGKHYARARCAEILNARSSSENA